MKCNQNGYIEKRKHARAKMNKQFKIKINGSTIVAESIDFSCVGAYCRVDRYIPFATKMKILIPTGQYNQEDGVKFVEYDGVVVRTKRVFSNNNVDNMHNIAISSNGIECLLSDNLDYAQVKPRKASVLELYFIRSLDISISFLLLLAFSPLIVLLMLIIRLDSNGPAIFKQPRVGFNGELFTLYKLRTMQRDAEFYAPDISKLDEPNIQLRQDNPYTRLGKWLRIVSLDELPQLINVLKGEMSLVGPRPLIKEEVDQFPAVWKQLFLVMPGITGLAQISGRSDLPVARIIQFDLEWVQDRGLWVYIKIMLFSLKKVLISEHVI